MVNTNLLDAYRKAREPNFSPYGDRKMFPVTASHALSMARFALEAEATRKAWEEAGGETVCYTEASDDWTPGDPRVRIVVHPDDDVSFEDMCGDCFNPDVNPDIKPEILEAEKEAYREKLNRDGVWGYVSEYWDGNNWEHADSVFGCDSDLDEGYATDLMNSAMEALGKVREKEARALEESRPDMYAV